MYSPENYELNWWPNINQKSHLLLMTYFIAKLFERWRKITYFECNYWFYSFYEKNWWITLSFLIYGIISLFLFLWLKIWKFNLMFSCYIFFSQDP